MKKRGDRFRKLKILIRKGRINPMLWLVHFSGLTAKEFPEGKFPTCQNCVDLQIGVCSGGWDPLVCMKKQSGSIVMEVG